MDRRKFFGVGFSTAVCASPIARALSKSLEPAVNASGFAPMALGLLIAPARGAAETPISRVKELGLSTCFLSLDDYVGEFTTKLAEDLQGLLHKYEVTPTAAEVVGPGKLVWDFIEGPSTIGIVPRATRAARMNALKQTSDFVKMLGIPNIQTHCGFIPENPSEPLYQEAVVAIRELTDYCAGNGQFFLMETGQETPTTMSRMIKDVGRPTLGVGLDTANLILYGKANPVDAVDILGPHIRSVHAKDGKWPTDPDQLGQEVVIGKGLVDFKQVFTKLQWLGYSGAISIEREILGPQQIEDVRKEKIYLERILGQIPNRPTKGGV
jgi:L-ribulose-5-phosphate 3-epimerase